MHKSSATLASAALSALLLAGCSSSGGLFSGNPLTTQSISTSPTGTATTTAAAPKIDPACYALAQRIETLRADGLTERLEKASVGKSSTVQVKRTSLAQAADLDKANAEFQARCSTLGPRTAQGAPAVNSAQVVSATSTSGGAAVAPPVVVQRP
ncbi:hypothetical protein [Hyphomicrobium sp.]|uniref:hypothetical protein n=1 Tax=Hyphomicrobium sp. TaxID=82 RepID=UPI0025C24D3C|nr:hypothetical protein [Hyphomicrobium sp.]MCC7250884.1 hypothetical protein [Hyphomicrobium sp.]